MALQNNIISGPNTDINYGAYTNPGQTFEWKFTVTLADIVALGAFTSGDVILIKIPARAYITHTFTKHSTAVAGPSISACTALVQTANGTRGAGTLDVFAAPGAAGYDLFVNPTATLKESVVAVTPVFLHIVATGANLSVATAGQIDVVIGYRVLP